MNLPYRSLIAAFLACWLPCNVLAEQIDEVTEQYWWQDNSRWSLDFSARSNTNRTQDDWSGTYFLGLDYHKVFSSESGDIGTLVFQPYWTQLDNAANHAPMFDDGDDGELIWRIANFNYTALSQGGFNIRVGHFEVPFGLEHNIDTNGTPRQYTFGERGIKADWGVSFNGRLPALDYEIALTRGTGNKISSRDNPYVFSARLGSSSDRNFIVGLSWLNGEIQTPNGTTRQQHAGIDAAYYYRNWELLLELSTGEQDGNSRWNALSEISWRNSMEDIHTYLQLKRSERNTFTGTRDSDSLHIGAQWLLGRRFDVSGQWNEAWIDQGDLLQIRSRQSSFTLQARFRM